MSVEECSGKIRGVGGLRIFFRGREVERPRGRLVAVHGLGEHSGRYARVAEMCTRHGLDFYALDLRGHGLSDGRRGHARSLDRMLQDLDRLRRRVCGRRPSGPTFLLGHSLGGLIAGRYVQEFGFPGLGGAILVAPFVGLVMQPPRWKILLGIAADRLAPALTMDNELRSQDLFRDPEQGRVYDEDPLVHHRISARLWGEMQRNAQRLRERARSTTAPLLLQVPGRDRVVSSDATRDLAMRIGERARVLEYPEAFHALLHDPMGERAVEDAILWVEAGLANGTGARTPPSV